MRQQQCNTGPQLQLSGAIFEDSIEIIADKMCDDTYRKHVQSFNQSQYEFFTHVMLAAKMMCKETTCCLHGGT